MTCPCGRDHDGGFPPPPKPPRDWIFLIQLVFVAASLLMVAGMMVALVAGYGR